MDLRALAQTCADKVPYPGMPLVYLGSNVIFAGSAYRSRRNFHRGRTPYYRRIALLRASLGLWSPVPSYCAPGQKGVSTATKFKLLRLFITFPSPKTIYTNESGWQQQWGWQNCFTTSISPRSQTYRRAKKSAESNLVLNLHSFRPRAGNGQESSSEFLLGAV